MKRNIGAFDGVLRMILAFVIFSYATFAGPWWLVLISIGLIATAALFRCPLYSVAGFTTCDQEEANL